MAKAVNLQNLVKHIVNGTLAENLCRICLLPLNDLYEDIFTNICKENNEYCVADVLNTVCQIKVRFSVWHFVNLKPHKNNGFCIII